MLVTIYFSFSNNLVFALLLYFSIITLMILFISEFVIKIELFLLFIIGVIILFPPIKISSGLPIIRIEEFIMYGIFPLLWFNFRMNKVSVNLNAVFSIMIFTIALSTWHANTFLDYRFTLRDLFEIIKILKIWLVIFIISKTKIEDRVLLKIPVWILYYLFISAIIGILQTENFLSINNYLTPLYSPEHHADYATHRILGTSSNPNDFGLLLNLGIILSLIYWIHNKKGTKLWMLPLIFTMLVTLLLTGSRTSVAALIIVYTSLLFYHLFNPLPRFSKIQILIILIITIVIGLIVGTYIAIDSIQRLVSGINIAEDKSFLMRLSRWQIGWLKFKQSPIFGWGPAKEFQSTVVDSEYLLTLRRYGIVGIFPYLAFFIVPIIHIKKYSKNIITNRWFYNSMISLSFILLITNITSITINNEQIMDLWAILLGITYSLINKRKNENINYKPSLS